MAQIALRMLMHRRLRFVFTIAGVSVLFFLCLAQVGLLVGWCNTTSAIISHAGVDVWVMAEQTPAFDYGTAIPRLRVFQARSVPGVAWAEGMFMAWNVWQRPDGRRVNVELIGLDESCVGGPWSLREGEITSVHLPESVIVDELFLSMLGVVGVGDEAELSGRRARVRGISMGVRTFTASPFVFTNIDAAVGYDRRYASDEITFVLVRCNSDADPTRVAQRIREAVPDVEVLTGPEFIRRTVGYWMLETGVGITVVLTAILGLLVSVVITSQTLFAITQENAGHYAALFAFGFSRLKLTGAVIVQALIVGIAGMIGGFGLFQAAAVASSRSPIPLEMTSPVLAMLAAIALVSSAVSSCLSLQSVVRLDPATVFRT